MNKAAGLMTSEVVTAIMIVVVCIAVAFGMYISNERDTMVERAKASLEAVRARVEASTEEREPIVCSDLLVSAEVLENTFLALSIRPTRIDESDGAKGYGAGIHVRSNKQADGNNAFDTAKRFYTDIKENQQDALRVLKKDDEEIEFLILASNNVQCSNSQPIAAR